MCCHLDHLRIRYLPDDNVTDPRTDRDDWSVSSTYTSPTIEGPLNVSQPSTSCGSRELTQLSVRQSTRTRNSMDHYTQVSI